VEIFRFAVSLHLRHPSIEPALITEELGSPPLHQWRAGAKPGAPEAYWCSPQRRGEDAELISVLEGWVLELESKKDFLLEFTSSGGEIAFSIGWFTGERSGGVALDPTLLGRLATLSISLELDVYGSS
jgi:hypothetical protein